MVMDSIYIPPKTKSNKKPGITLALRKEVTSEMIYFIDPDAGEDRITVVNCSGEEGQVRVKVMTRADANVVWEYARKKDEFVRMDPQVAYDFIHWIIKDLRDDPVTELPPKEEEVIAPEFPENTTEPERLWDGVIADGKMGMVMKPAEGSAKITLEQATESRGSRILRRLKELVG